MKTPTFNATLPVTAQDIAYLMIAALEGGSNYWMSAIRLKGSETNTDPAQRAFWHDKDNDADCLKDEEYWTKLAGMATNVPLVTLVVELAEEEEGDDIVTKVVTAQTIHDTMTYLYSRKGGFDMENHDACDADCFLQHLLFGEVVYG